MNVKLTRYESTSNGTFGVLTLDDGTTFETIERPWLNNEPFKSCVPAGEYDLVPHSSNKYGNVLCMINIDGGVTHYKEDNSIRYACLIHAANYVKDVVGCIGIGRKRVGQMVTSSRIATNEFYSIVKPNEDHKLTIEYGVRP